MPKQSNKPKRENMPYRDCAGCVVFNANGKVLVCERKSNKQGKHVWQFPQGGIDSFEEPIDAALRELYEETSIKSTSLITAASDWIYYDLPDEYLGVALKGKFRGQRQKWFALLFEGNEKEINVIEPANGKFKAEFSNWRWVKLKQTPDLIVPFKRQAYEQIVASFEHIVKNLKQQSINVKKLKPKHIDMWVELRHKFSPNISRKYLKADCTELLKNKSREAFGLFDTDMLIGFAQVANKNNNNNAVALLEAIYISHGYRQMGLDKKLLKSVEKWVKKRELNEIHSDVFIDDERSILIHSDLGFSETKRIVQFVKKL